jgi:phosphohistidine phosphatase
MKKIVFVRHGRAEEEAGEITDFERSLTSKGKSISRTMARRFREIEPDPGLITTSPAFRALETALIFAIEFEIKPERIIMDSGLYYQTDFNSLFNLLNTITEQAEILTLFGHNPAFTQIPDRLCIGGCEFLTKTSVVGISFETKTWTGIKPASGNIDYFLKPEK